MATIFIKTIIIYLFVLLAVRLMGKREIGQLQPLELVVIIIIADVASTPMEEVGTPILQGIIPIFALVVAQLVLSYLNIKFPYLHKLICGKASVLISKGVIVEENLRRQRYTLDGLIEQMRVAGYPNISEIEYAILENNGTLSVFPYSKGKKNMPLPLPIILDSSIQKDALKCLGKTEEWVYEMLKSKNILLEDVFYAFYKDNNIFIIRDDELL